MLDPGLAFGTGSHPTTRLCLQWLRDATLRGGERVLDYGCGSGILAIAAAQLGAARRASASTSIRRRSTRAARTRARNGVDGDVRAARRARPARRSDVVVANILANPLIVLAPLLARACGAGGRIALSGILVEQADDVVAAYAPWFTLAAWRTADGWVLLAGTRHS